MKIKYTTDGKKVSVVGKLNSQETIVQEIFVSSGNEIPSGENFVVKSLHDHPVESWKEKKLKDLEERYHKESRMWNDKIEKQEKKNKEQLKRLESIYQGYRSIMVESENHHLDNIVDLLQGKITHVVILGYSPEIVEFDEAVEYKDSYYSYKNELKLISVLGNSKGDIKYRINRYSDGSGSAAEVRFFKSLNEATEFFKAHIIERAVTKGVNRWILDASKKYNVEIPAEAINAFVKKETDQISKNIQNYNKQIVGFQQQISELQKLNP